jgi:hypothetical protein
MPTSQKKSKSKKSRPLPKPNPQIPNSLVRQLNYTGPTQQLANARDYPLYGCWIMEGWQEEGMTPVVVAREQEPRMVMFGVYMVDQHTGAHVWRREL